MPCSQRLFTVPRKDGQGTRRLPLALTREASGVAYLVAYLAALGASTWLLFSGLLQLFSWSVWDVVLAACAAATGALDHAGIGSSNLMCRMLP